MQANNDFSLARIAAILLALSGGAYAQWTSQTRVLQPGWNAVFLEVEPEDNTCDAVFGNMPIDSVWAWVKEFSPAQFVRDPNTLTPDLPDWLVHFPADHPKRFLRSLHEVFGGRCYLIELRGTVPVTWTIIGTTVVRTPDWLPDSFNLVGFHLDPGKGMSVRDFLAASPNLAANQVYRVTASGESELIADPAKSRFASGEAYWIYSKGDSRFAGPVTVEFDNRDGLEFGKLRVEQPLRIVNHTNAVRTITLKLLPSLKPARAATPSGEQLAAGPVALSFKRLLAWHPLPDTLTFEVEPNQTGAVPLAVRRSELTPAADPNAVYESVLEVSDDLGMRFRVPVTAARAVTPAGLWVGNVRLNGVSEAGNPQDNVTPRPTDSEFQFRLILHVDGSGQARLLQNVTLLQTQETDTEPSRYVLLTREDLMSEYMGVSVRGERLVGRRITSPAFSFRDPVSMSGSLDTTLSGSITVAYDDPLNPFLHRYHPDHDNLDERYQQVLAAGRESLTFSRNVTLEFTEDDPEQMGLPEWGDEVIGGIYNETITGVHQRAVHVQGTFLLNKVTEVPVLNDGR